MNRKEILDLIKTENSGYHFTRANDELKNDYSFIKEALSIDGQLLEYVDAKYQDDINLVKIAVKTRKIKIAFNTALQYASLRLRDNKEVVLEAVKTNGFALQYASLRLRDDLEVVLAAVDNYGQALQWASEKLRKDEFVAKMAIHNDPDAEKYQIKTKVIHCMVEKELCFDYLPVLHDDEKVLYRDGTLYVSYEGKEEVLPFDKLMSIEKDKLYLQRLNHQVTIEEAKAALYDMENPKYRMLFLRDEDLAPITADEFKKILAQYGTGSFSYHAYREI